MPALGVPPRLPRANQPGRLARRLARRGDDRADAIRLFNRGVLMAEEGMILAAVKAYSKVMDGGDADLAARSAFNIATLSAQIGDFGWAVIHYSAGIGFGDPDVTPKAAFNLAQLLERGGDLDGAQRALALAAESNHQHVAPQARNRLRALGAAAKPSRRC